MDSATFHKLCGIFGLKIAAGEDTRGLDALSAEMQAEILLAFGLDPSDDRLAAQAMSNLQGRLWRQPLDPALVQQEAQFIAFELRLPRALFDKPIHWLITEENSSRHEGEIIPAAHGASKEAEIDGQPYTAAQVRLTAALPCGYHNLSITAGTTADTQISGTCRLIITPASCFLPPGLEHDARVWGLSCNLNSLRSRRNWGVGDFSDLRNLLSWGAENGAGCIALRSLQPIILPQSEPRSPFPVSGRSFLNPLYIDPEAIDDFQDCNEARDLIRNSAFQAHLATMRDQDATDFREITDIKINLLEILWRHFRQNHLNPELPRGEEFRHFQISGGKELQAFSLFSALQAHFKKTAVSQRDWTAWPKAYQDPQSPEVADFALKHKERLEFHQYIQWQADLQLASIGRRSMELGFKVGLLPDLTFDTGIGSFETWHYRQMYAMNMRSSSIKRGVGYDTHLVPILPTKLAEVAYTPFIVMLRAGMRQAGALRIHCRDILQDHHYWNAVYRPEEKTIRVSYPTHDLIAIIALESLRNRCMVICEYSDELPDDCGAMLRHRGILISRSGNFERDEEGGYQPPGQYKPLSIATAGSDLQTLGDFWLGKDILLQTQSYQSEAEAAQHYEKEIIARAADRAHLLVALHREGLLPEGYGIDPITFPQLTATLAQAVHLFLARSSAKIFQLSLEDIPSLQDLDLPERFSLKPFIGQRRLPIDLESMQADQQLSALMQAFCQERGPGVVRPSALLADRRRNKTAKIPKNFYRLQLHAGFTFRQAMQIVPYLSELGISHCYISPYLKARPGSTHGYDIIDHSTLNPEIGSREDYEAFVEALAAHGMAQILDIVPNHMGVGSDNNWWLDVLENGQASLYADFFDINWHPQLEELKGRVLLPVLGDYYGALLESGLLRLEFSADKGAFCVTYYEHWFPVAPKSYPFILSHDLQRLEHRLGPHHEGFLELQNLIASLAALPDRQERELERIEMRHRNKEVLKRLLARLCDEFPEISAFLQENIILINGEKGRPESFELLHTLLGMQAYRLAFWRVASDEINYRRFFDINDLAGIRVEKRQVFTETHRLILDLIATGKIDGLRIDHPDGLYNPAEYCRWLQNAVISGRPIPEEKSPADDEARRGLPLYVVVEKVLASFEKLPLDWPVHGTTGYDFAFMLNGLFVDSRAEKALTTIYHEFIGDSLDPDFLIYNSKKLIIRKAMAGELNVLTDELHNLAKMNRYTQDYTWNGLREALIEIIAFFPVYRTYITAGQISGNERNYIEWAVAKARDRHQADEDTSIYDFIKTVLLLEAGPGENESFLAAAKNFVMKLQQYTGPIMAKGLEDTFFYLYNRLLSLNEVGGDPRHFGVSVAAFHHANHERHRHWPHAMLNTSTHDSKRSEDIRARINVLSEMAPEWQLALKRWSTMNLRYKSKIHDYLAPSKNDEYALYQNLLGVWPASEPSREEKDKLMGRFADYMLKVIREAKVHTRWLNPNLAYEEAMSAFVYSLFDEGNNHFLKDFVAFHKKITWFGMLNSLAQLLLKLTSPGVPDIYQGNEMLHFTLVDPDNRRPVDFEKRRILLEELKNFSPEQSARLLDDLDDGRVKLYTTWRVLRYRLEHPELFEHGSYLTIATNGKKKEHLCAFARCHSDRVIIVAVPRLVAGLLDKQEGRLPVGRETWQDTVLELPDNLCRNTYQNILTGEKIQGGGENNSLAAAELFSNFPLALLENESLAEPARQA